MAAPFAKPDADFVDPLQAIISIQQHVDPGCLKQRHSKTKPAGPWMAEGHASAAVAVYIIVPARPEWLICNKMTLTGRKPALGKLL